MASDPQMNAWNEQWRGDPRYASIMRSIGVDPTRPIKLTDTQRKQVRAAVEQQFGFTFPKGTEIDPAGNWNANEGFGKQAKRWGPIVGGAALAAFGIPGVMPGLFSGGGAGWVGSEVGKVAAAAGGAGGGGAATAGKFLGLGASDWLTAALFGGQTLANVWGTKQQVGATDRAAEAQLQANREALDFLKQQWETARADFQPWLNAETTAGNRLNEYLTTLTRQRLPENLERRRLGEYDPDTYLLRPAATPPSGGWARPPSPTMAQFNQPSSGFDLSKRPDNVSTTMPVPVPRAPRPGNDAAALTPTLADFNRPPVSSTQPMRNSRLVRVQAPDGEIRELPLVQAARAMQLGARRVA